MKIEVVAQVAAADIIFCGLEKCCADIGMFEVLPASSFESAMAILPRADLVIIDADFHNCLMFVTEAMKSVSVIVVRNDNMAVAKMLLIAKKFLTTKRPVESEAGKLSQTEEESLAADILLEAQFI